MLKSAQVMPLAALFLCLGCPSDDEPESAADRLVGAWLLEIGEDCAAAYIFGADGEYEERYLCLTGGNTADMEVYGGSFTATDDAIHLEPRGGSCSREDAGGFAEAASIRYQLQDDGQTLRTTNVSGVVYYERAVDDGMPSSSGIIRLGCFIDGVFEPREAAAF